jgi:pyruvate,water dikinase
VAVEVVVQKMVQSEISGITFTVHPVTKKKDDMIIEAGYGLGEAIVGGKITPDSYVISKSKIKTIDKYISEQEMMIIRNANGIKETKVPKNLLEKQKLTDKQILELAVICIKIEKHYKKPQDIEWALEKGKFYIVQSRPITTL